MQQFKTMKLYLMVEYTVPSNNMTSEDIERAHKEVFEEQPGDFINYLLSMDSSSVEYGFEESTNEDNGAPDDHFDCNMYYHNPTDFNLCLKYGVLCSHSFCKDLNK